MKQREGGKINPGVIALLIGGLALAGLLVYGWKTGQELPVWPAVAVVLVNLVAAGKIAFDTIKAKKQSGQNR